jgi:hypothetical protein
MAPTCAEMLDQSVCMYPTVGPVHVCYMDVRLWYGKRSVGS